MKTIITLITLLLMISFNYSRAQEIYVNERLESTLGKPSQD